MKSIMILAAIILAAVGCTTIPQYPQWSAYGAAEEAEYDPYLKSGTGSVSGQGFLSQRNGGVVKSAGRAVTLDPATKIGVDWFYESGKFWAYRNSTPPSPNFEKARRATTADADGRFSFANLPAGRYYVRTEVTWEVGSGYYSTQGGFVGDVIDVEAGKNIDVILSSNPY